MTAKDTQSPGPSLLVVPLTDRVNSEPPIINGIAASEASYAGALSFAISLFVGGSVSLLTGYWQILVTMCILVPLATIWYLSLYLQKVKRGRPDGFYLHRIHLYLVSRKLIKPKFIVYNGYMQLGCRYRMGSIQASEYQSEEK